MNTISIYSDLPSGGANRLYLSNYLSLKKVFNVKVLKDPLNSQIIRNIFVYYLYIYIVIPFNNKKLIPILNKSSALLAYPSWITKSPVIMRFSKVPVIYVCHEPPREFYDNNYIRLFSIKDKIVNYIGLLIKNIDRSNIRKTKNITIVANSKYSANQIEKCYGIKPEIIYPGIALKKFGKNSNLNVRKNQIICVGSINKLKNQKFIVDCVSKIESTIRPTLVLVGNGGDSKYLDEIKKIATESNVKVTIYLNISDKKLVSLYKESKIFAYAPIHEPFGLVILEAMACGLPLVTVNNGGFSEILTKDNGSIICNFQADLWATQISNILENSLLWQTYSKYNYEYSRRYSDANMNKQLIDILNKKIYN